MFVAKKRRNHGNARPSGPGQAKTERKPSEKRGHAQVLEMDEKALLSVRNLGQKSMEEIRDKLIERGYIPRSSLLSATNGTEPGEI